MHGTYPGYVLVKEWFYPYFKQNSKKIREHWEEHWCYRNVMLDSQVQVTNMNITIISWECKVREITEVNPSTNITKWTTWNNTLLQLIRYLLNTAQTISSIDRAFQYKLTRRTFWFQRRWFYTHWHIAHADYAGRKTDRKSISRFSIMLSHTPH